MTPSRTPSTNDPWPERRTPARDRQSDAATVEVAESECLLEPQAGAPEQRDRTSRAGAVNVVGEAGMTALISGLNASRLEPFAGLEDLGGISVASASPNGVAMPPVRRWISAPSSTGPTWLFV